jgi:phage baseplate assembly protein gpV
MSLTPPITGSKLHVYGLGIVAANKELSSKFIECVPIEALPMLDGELSDNMVEITTKGQDSSGGSYETAVNTTVSIRAEWLPIGISNRVTPPDVRRGEHIVLYKFGDTDKYYWTTLLYDMKLRKLETVIFAISNTQNEDADGTADTTYFIEVSTHKKLIHLHTSKSDGEPFVYDLQLNTKDGVFTFQDDIGNYVQLDSKNVRIEMKNADGSWIDMNRKTINIYAPEDINMKADNNINIEAGSSINSKAGTSINDETAEITTKADTTTNEVPSTSFTGNVAIAGALGTAGLTSLSGGLSVQPGAGGGFIVQGDGQFTGHVTVNKLTSSQPITAPNVE